MCPAYACLGKRHSLGFFGRTTSPDYPIRFWDVATGQERRRLRLGPSNPFRIALPPDGDLLAALCREVPAAEGRLRLWDVVGGKELASLVPADKDHPLRASNMFCALAFCPDYR